MPRYCGDMRNVQPHLEQPGNTVVPEIVEVQIGDSQHLAGACECSAYRIASVGEDRTLSSWHCLDDPQRFRGQVAPDVVAHLLAWILHISDHDSRPDLIEVCPLDSCDFVETSCRKNRKCRDCLHWVSFGAANSDRSEVCHESV